MRWEAAKALGKIGDPKAALALVGALEDPRSGIRWLAAEGLMAIGREALRSFDGASGTANIAMGLMALKGLTSGDELQRVATRHS